MNNAIAALGRAIACVALASLIAGCAWNRETVVLLPDNDRSGASALSVTNGERAIVLDRPYAAARQTWYSGTQSYTSSAEEVQTSFGPALAAQPKRPMSFLLYFDEGSEDLTVESKATFDSVFKEIAAYPVPDIVVIGHTDAVGNDARNDPLSVGRAENVRTLLVTRGIAPEYIAAEGRGKRQPLVPTPDGVAEPRNRRVEIIVR